MRKITVKKPFRDQLSTGGVLTAVAGDTLVILEDGEHLIKVADAEAMLRELPEGYLVEEASDEPVEEPADEKPKTNSRPAKASKSR